MPLPVVYAVFANQEKDYLPYLGQERIAMQDSFKGQESKILLSTLETDNSEELFKDFDKYPKQISIFHYAGHANSQMLQIGNATYLEGLGKELLRQNPAIQLVFLNGCSTKKLVEVLFKRGFNAVIATAVKIEDELAKKFATRFYETWLKGNKISDAYESACNLVLMADKQRFAYLENNRFTEFTGSENDTDEFPWGLYVREDLPAHEREDILNLTIAQLNPEAPKKTSFIANLEPKAEPTTTLDIKEEELEELKQKEDLKEFIFQFNFSEQEQCMHEALKANENFAILGLNNNTEDEAKFLFRLLENRLRNNLRERNIETVFYTLSPKITQKDEVLIWADDYLGKKRQTTFCCFRVEGRVDKVFLKEIVQDILKDYKNGHHKPCIVLFLIKPKFLEDIDIIPHSSEKVAQTKEEDTLQAWIVDTQQSFVSWASNMPKSYYKQDCKAEDVFNDYIYNIDCIENYIDNQKKYVYYLLEKYIQEIGYNLQITDNLEIQLTPCNPK